MWMSLEELAQTPDFQSRLVDEFPQGAAVWEEGLSRRSFLQLMGASIALAGLNGCMRLPEQKIIPYTDQPEKLVPGRPLHFATTLQINGHPRGVVVTQNEGRPTHISGNPLHPMSLGAADVWTTASLLDLYDPDRLQTVLNRGSAASWETFSAAFSTIRNDALKVGGSSFCLLTPPINSPSELRLIHQILAAFPQASWYVHDPLASVDLNTSAPTLNLTDADVIFALESDFLYDRPDSLALIRAFSRRRRSDNGTSWNRLYVAESCPTVTGVKADHRFPVSPQEFEDLALTLAGQLSGRMSETSKWPWLATVVADLKQHAGRSILLAGNSASNQVREAIREANQALGNIGKTITLSPLSDETLAHGTLNDLATRIKTTSVGTLLMLDVNPAYDAPADLSFGELLKKVSTTISHTFYADETSVQCTWVLPATHGLEAWNDAKACDGTLSIGQPLIAPLYDGKSTLEALSLVCDGLGQSGYDLVRETWQATAPLPPEAFEVQWHRWLRTGVIQLSPASASSSLAPTSSPGILSGRSASNTAVSRNLWLSFRVGSAMWDGRHANNGWLQELPDPITKLTWDNATLLSPATAAKLECKDGDVLALTVKGTQVSAPVLVVPGHADECLTLPLGYGRTVCGSVGKNIGCNAYLVRRSDALWQVPLDKVEKTGRVYPLARTQEHFRMEGRDLLHVSRVDEMTSNAAPTSPPKPLPSLFPDVAYNGHRWALTIDLNSCVGCNACIVACQSENNIPVVGKKQVLMGREMQWIRVDRYYQGSTELPRTHFQPVTCMQCEKAPCEVVCPVAATQHDDEGLNVMVYNRCVGTRYCSNNCPYKVRRFNFLFYNADIPESQRLRLNPNVTVRSRGVMEKCTYCVQRIEEARIGARREHRPLRGEDVITACQASCPAEAIVFGDLSDPQSTVSKNRQKPGHYAMLAELDTQPRTTYLEKRINPNPGLEPKSNEPASPNFI